MSWSLGKAIKKVRIDKGISQRDLAHQAGLRQAHLSLIENDHHDPSATIVRTLARVLGVSADVLLGLSGEEDTAGVPPGHTRQDAAVASASH
jgi:transcriptional regulator with XRE-family HTH domain